jgi:hypothetical protein
MKTIAMLATLAATSLLAKDLDGTYKGVVEGDNAVLILKADGTALVKPPDAEEGFRIRGKWKLAEPGVVLEITAPGNPNEKVTVRFRIGKGELLLVSVTEADGNVKTYAPPRFKQTKAGDKKFTGEYKGVHDEKALRVVLKDGGVVKIWPDDPNAPEPQFRGKWEADGDEVTCTVETDDGPARVHLKRDGKDFLMVKLEDADGEVTEYQAARLKRTKKAAGKPLPDAAKKLVGVYEGEVEDDIARVELRADGTATALPNVDQPDRKMEGKWALDGETVKTILNNDDGEGGTVVFEVVKGDLKLVKIIEPDGEVEEFKAILRKQK